MKKVKNIFFILILANKQALPQVNNHSKVEFESRINYSHIYDPNNNEHAPLKDKAELSNKMNPINEVVHMVRTKLEAVANIFNLSQDYSKANPELGPYKLSNGSTYFGGFIRGNFHGYGTQIWPDGSIYEGMFSNDMANGKGRLINEDGGCYVGDFSKSKAEGKGEYFNLNGIYYKGEFLNNLRHGYGEEEFGDSSVYKGFYDKGVKQGEGTFIWADGSVYTGTFKNNAMDGYGVYTWSDGRVYEGTWKDNNIHGKGVTFYLLISLDFYMERRKKICW